MVNGKFRHLPKVRRKKNDRGKTIDEVVGMHDMIEILKELGRDTFQKESMFFGIFNSLSSKKAQIQQKKHVPWVDLNETVFAVIQKMRQSGSTK